MNVLAQIMPPRQLQESNNRVASWLQQHTAIQASNTKMHSGESYD